MNLPVMGYHIQLPPGGAGTCTLPITLGANLTPGFSQAAVFLNGIYFLWSRKELTSMTLSSIWTLSNMPSQENFSSAYFLPNYFLPLGIY